MKNITFTAVDPEGRVHTRTTQSRAYTHTVVALPNEAKTIAWVTSKEQRLQDENNFAHYAAYLDGTSEFLPRNLWEHDDAKFEARVKKGIANAVERLAGASTAQEYADMRMKAVLERIADMKSNGFYDTYQSYGWCGRLDLAHKLKAKLEGQSWLRVTILEAVKKC
jgi:hypothetical protein